MKNRNRQFHSSGLPALLVLAVFALCLLRLLLTAGTVYADLTEEGQLHHNQRTAVNYLSTRLRQGNGVYREDFGGMEALVFPEEIDGEGYITRIYCYDGWLRELYTAKDGTFSPGDGEKLLEMERFSVIMEDGPIILEFLLPGGEAEQVIWQIREDGL